MSAQPPQPNLLWQFEYSNVDSVTGLSPLASNNSTISYNSSGKYNSSIVINTNNAAGAPASYLEYSLAALPSITVTCWIKPLSVSSASNQVVWGIGDSTGTVLNWLQFIILNSIMSVYGNNPTTSVPLQNVQTVPTPVQNGVWYHTALTMSASGAVYVYLNGVEIGPLQQYSGSTPNGVYRQLWSTWTASSLVVGSNTRFPGVNSGAWCEYDDLRVFNSVLSAAQIQTIYAAGGMPNQVSLSGQSASPSLLWTFENSPNDLITNLPPDTVVGTSTYVAGQYRQAIKFDQGSSPSSYIRYTLPPYSPNNFSFSYWVNMTEIPVPTVQAPVYISTDTADILFRFSFNPVIGSGQVPYGPGGDYTNPGRSIKQGTWVHLALVSTWNGTSNVISMYQNGISYYSPTVTLTSSKLTFLYLSNYNSNYSNCAIDDLRVYTSALTAAQVQSIYNQSAVPVTSISLTGTGTITMN